MARLTGNTLFFVTSPRTPEKIIPEIKLLTDNYSGQRWNKDSQLAFITELSQAPFFEGSGSATYSDFSARDRINRAPKALGFVDLSPTISLTEQGQQLLSGKRTSEVFLRQFLKFQLPSPYHTKVDDNDTVFCVRPYLELFRLIRTLGKVTFDEMRIYGMTLTDYHNFDNVVLEIQAFRREKEAFRGNYKTFIESKIEQKIRESFRGRIITGDTQTRESADASLAKFIKTQKSNLRDYTDALFRYLRCTGMVAISAVGHSISIKPEKIREVDFFLENTPRDPVYIENEVAFKNYLFSASEPALYTDSRENLINYLTENNVQGNLVAESIESLKDKKDLLVKTKQNEIVSETIRQLKTYEHYDDIIEMYGRISHKEVFDEPLMFEWNTWRAMTMIDGGNIIGNFNIDDYGDPISTASGNRPDIVCDYNDFDIIVEVTLTSGQRQYEAEGEPVARHLGKHKASKNNRDTFCLFIAPVINESVIAHFYALHRTNISYYGGKACIIPVSLDVFNRMLYNSAHAREKPTPEDLKSLFTASMQIAEQAESENDWYSQIQTKLSNWMVA